MADLREIEDAIVKEAAHLEETLGSPDAALKVLEMAQKEVHHREMMIRLNKIIDSMKYKAS